MNKQMMTAVLMASIAEGHVDLADLFFLLAAIVLTFVAVVELIGKNVVVSTKALCVIAGALVAWAFFVL